jgi:hypothetical protein
MNDRKIRQPAAGDSKPPATRLKELSVELQAKVMDLLTNNSYQNAEPLVTSLVGFACSTDVLFRFRKWHEAKQEMKLGDERFEQIKEFLQKEMPKASPEKLRELGVMFRTLTALGNGDGQEFVNVSRMQLQSEREKIRARKLDLEERKFQEALRKKLDAGLDALGQILEENPAAMKHFQRARKLVEERNV